MRYAILLLILLSVPTSAQTPGSCERGVAIGELNADGSEVFARVFNVGTLFYSTEHRLFGGYLVPRPPAQGIQYRLSPLAMASLWIGGKVAEETRVAGTVYSFGEFWPGPLNPGATLPNPVDCSAC